MKKLSFILLSLMILVSCRSMTSKGRSVNTAEKQIKNGNYYEAILNLSNALIADPDYKPAIEGLNSIFSEAINNQEEKVSLMKTTGSLRGPVRKMRIYNVKHCFLLYLLNSSYFYTIQN